MSEARDFDTKCNKGSNMATKQNCASCKWASIATTECTYPPLNLPEATWKFITAHHAHPVKTTPHGGAECAMYDRKPGRPDPDPDARMCGNCEFFAAESEECNWDGPVPFGWGPNDCGVEFHDGKNCVMFKKINAEPEIVPATIDDVTGGPWTPKNPGIAWRSDDLPQPAQGPGAFELMASNNEYVRHTLVFTEADVRRIVREELADIERSKPTTDNP